MVHLRSQANAREVIPLHQAVRVVAAHHLAHALVAADAERVGHLLLGVRGA